MIPAGGVAIVDGTSITDAALARKLEAAFKRDPAVRVRLGHDPRRADRAGVIRALVQKAGVTNVELVTP
jgi:biopolymer transport protein ExbD